MVLFKILAAFIGIVTGVLLFVAAVLLVYILVTDWLHHRRIAKILETQTSSLWSTPEQKRLTILKGGKNETKNGNS